MTLKPPTRTFPKLVMKDWPDKEMAALVDLSDRDFFATVMGKKALSDFTRVVEQTGILKDGKTARVEAGVQQGITGESRTEI